MRLLTQQIENQNEGVYEITAFIFICEFDPFFGLSDLPGERRKSRIEKAWRTT